MGTLTFLLCGASRPTAVHFHKGRHVADMLATPEPTLKDPESPSHQRMAWPAALKALSAEPDGLVKFKLSWDRFRDLYSSEISRYALAPNNVPTQWEAMTAIDHLSLFLEQVLCYIRAKTTIHTPNIETHYQFIPLYLIHIPKEYELVICP